MELINIGNLPDDGTGDTLRVAGEKINANFSSISSRFSNSIALSNTTYYTSTSDYFIGITSVPATVYLHEGAAGQQLIIKDCSGNASSYPITVIGQIDSSDKATLRISHGALSLIYADVWRII